MYLRRSIRKKNDKTHVSWRLARSVRSGKRVLQETVATLGELDAAERARARAFAASLGAPWLGMKLWQMLGLDALCAALLPAGREAVPWASMASILVIARLCEPSTAGKELRLHCGVRPDRHHSELLARLGIDLPARLRTREAPGMWCRL